MDKIQFIFMVCKRLHEKRTKPFYETVCKSILDKNHKVCLVSGFEQFDEIPVTKVCKTDNYYSCISKTLNGMIRFLDNKEDFDFFFIGDDDTYVNIDNLEKLILTLNKDELNVYGAVVPTNDKRGMFHVYGGTGILMNKRTFNVLAQYIKDNYIVDDTYSDVSLALNILAYNQTAKEKINMINLNLFLKNVGESFKYIKQNFQTAHLNLSPYSGENIYKLFD